MAAPKVPITPRQHPPRSRRTAASRRVQPTPPSRPDELSGDELVEEVEAEFRLHDNPRGLWRREWRRGRLGGRGLGGAVRRQRPRQSERPREPRQRLSSASPARRSPGGANAGDEDGDADDDEYTPETPLAVKYAVSEEGDAGDEPELHVLIRWRGFTAADDTWEAESMHDNDKVGDAIEALRRDYADLVATSKREPDIEQRLPRGGMAILPDRLVRPKPLMKAEVEF